MICAYCKKEKKMSREHIISCSILDLFPECFLTIDSARGKVYSADPIIKDVCEECNNNKISYIDSYAKNIISKYFVKKYSPNDTLNFDYDYTLIQKMLLKFAFNDLRSQKSNISFFNNNILDFLMNKDRVEPLRNITVLAGLSINTSILHDYMFGNTKIQWSNKVKFLSNSIISHINYIEGKINLRDKKEIHFEKFKKMNFSYVFRFNSVQFLLVCWDHDISDEDLKTNNIILKYQYPYTILNRTGNDTLSRCTSSMTYRFINLIDVVWGQGMYDEIDYMNGIYSSEIQQYIKEVEKDWKKQENILAKEHPR